MAPKRPLEEDGATVMESNKKPRKGFRVGPENLPDGPWRRKVTKVKQELIQKAKLKKAYSKIKAAEQHSAAGGVEGASAEVPEPQIHPQRQAMLDEDEPEEETPASDPSRRDKSLNADRPRRPRNPKQRRKPGYYDEALAEAGRNKAAQEEREEEMRRREEERSRKVAERERFRKAVIKARTPGRDGQRRLGRESGLLLEKVKRMVNSGS